MAGPPDEGAPGTGELSDLIGQRLDRFFGEEETQPEAQPEPEQPEAPQPADTGELSDLIDQRLDKFFGEEEAAPAPVKKPNKPREPRPPRPKQEQTEQEPTIGELATHAGQETVKGATDALKGLMDLFGGAGRTKLNVMPTFDEETYRKAKPMFEKAVEHFKGAARDIGQIIDRIIEELVNRFKMTRDQFREMHPYLTRFVKEFTEKLRKDERKDKPPEDTATHKVYRPKSKVPSVGSLVPINMATAVENALARLEAKVGSLDDYVAEKLDYKPEDIEGYFSAEQVDALALALDNIENGAGFVIGDQTGQGKGRVVAGIIRYAIKNDKVPIFVTEKPALYADMIRDLTDIGMADTKPLITNANEAVPISDEAFAWIAEVQRAKEAGLKRKIPRPKTGFLETPGNAEHAAKLEEVGKRGLNAAGYDVVFTTYNQMQKKKGESVARHDLLEQMSKGGVVIFDESHNAGGGPVQYKEGGEIVDDRARVARRLARQASAVFYSSATYAKRPEVMDLYFKTDLSKAVSNINKLPKLLKKGGVPLQQVTAAMLTEAGQYIRREKSFDGVDYKTVVVPVQRELAGAVGQVMSGVVYFDRLKQAAVATIRDGLKGGGQALAADNAFSVESSNFTALMHNVVDQMLLNLKAGPAADAAIAALRRGEKPVITVANTMGAFVEQFVEDNEIKSGEALDLDFGAVLLRYLDRSRRVTIKNPDRTKTYYYLTDEDLGPVALAQYNEVRRMIRDADFSSMAISPIDVIHQKLRAAGYKTGEITGRKFQIDYSEGVPIYRTRSAFETSTAGKRAAINGYNDGSVDALIINQSGATGISLHGSKKFKDNRQRHMVLAQAEKNVDTHVQMLGRTNRTGQVEKDDVANHHAPEGQPAVFGMPIYTQLASDLPSEKRPAAVLAKKMASLNANTTATRGSAVTAKDAVDFMNQFGDEVAANLMRESPDLWDRLGQPDYEDAEGNTREDAMRRVTGRIPLLEDIDEQEEIYQRLTEEYNDYVALQEAMGKNVLEAKTLDLRAETVESETLSPARGDESPFTRASNLERVKVKRLGKPMTSDQVTDLLRKALGEESGNLDQLERVGDQQVKTLITRIQGEADRDLEAKQNRIQKQIDQMREELARTEDSKAQTKLETAIRIFETNIEAARLNSQTGMLTWRTLVQTLHPGAQVQLEAEDGILYGVVTSLEKKGKSKNPIALSDWRVNVVVADAVRSIAFPLSQVTTESTKAHHKASLLAKYADSVPIHNVESGGFDYVPMEEAFDAGQSESKETRYIVAGNILAGFEQVDGKGQIINYTDKDGNVKQGIMMPKNWDRRSAMQNREVVFTTPDKAMEFLDADGQLRTADTHLRLIRGPGGVLVSATQAKGKGGKYYQNRRILSVINGKEFSGRRGSSVMTVTLTDREARDVVDMLISGEAMGEPSLLVAANKNDKAREIVEGKPPATLIKGEKPADDESIMVVQTMIGLNPAAATGAPVEFARMRARLPHLNKERFDSIMRRLNDEGRIAVHRHDYPQSLSDIERNRLVKIGNDYFIAATILERHAGFGLGALFPPRARKPKTTPLRQIADILGHEALKIDPVALEKETRETLIEALKRGKAGSLPFARATWWAEKLGAKKVAGALGRRQQQFILKTLQVVQEIAAASAAMDNATRGDDAWTKAQKRLDRLRIQLANRMSKVVEYAHPFEYVAKGYKASILSAPHIPAFNLLHQTLQFPMHEAQKMAEFLVPARVFNKWGIPYTKGPVDIRTWGPAIARELNALLTGAGSSLGDIKDMLYYGVTKTGLDVEAAEGLKGREAAQGTTDKYEFGHRPKMIPGLDQAIMEVGRTHGAADILYYNMVYATAVAAAAHATARQIATDHPQLNLTKAQIKEMARDLAAYPSPAMIAVANEEAAKFKLDYPTIGYNLLRWIRNFPVEKVAGRTVDAAYKAAFDLLLPILKIPLAAADTAFFRYSPAGMGRVATRLVRGRIAKANKKEIKGRFKTPEAFGRDTAELYRQSIVGTVVWLAASALGTLGYVTFTGGGEDDERPDMAAIREAQGERFGPEMVAGDTAYDLGRLGPTGQLMTGHARVSAAMKRRYDKGTQEPEPEEKRVMRVAEAARKGIFYENPIGRAIEDVGTEDTEFIRGKLRGVVPGALRSVAKMGDETRRIPDDASFTGKIRGDFQSGIPGQRQKLQPRLDALGREVLELSPFSFRRRVTRDPQLDELRDLDVGLTKPQRERGETAIDYNKRVRERGEMTSGTLGRLRESETMRGAGADARREIYESSLGAAQMKRAGRLSGQSVERELGIAGLRGQAYAELRKMPEYQALKDADRKAVRDLINEELNRFKAKASHVRKGKYGDVTVPEKAAKVPEWTPEDLARAALEARQ